MRDFGKSFSKNFVLKMFGLLVCLIFVCAAPHPAGAAMQQTDVDGSGIEICGIDGKTYTPNGFSEDIVILFFGRTGCPNTRNMIAQGKSLMNDYSMDKSLKLVLMDVDAEDAGMESFASANPELLVAHCEGGYSSLMFRLLSQTMEENISSVTLPATFVLRKDRRIVFASTGYDASGLADAVLSLSAEEPSKPSTEEPSKPSAEEPSKPSAGESSKPSAGGMSTQQGTTDSGSSSRKPNLKKPSLRSAKRKAGTKAVVKWKKVSGADGYELQMSTKSKKGFKRIAKLSAKKTAYTKKKLSKKKNYYFRLRAYKIVDGNYYYSDWSKVKKLSGSKK